MATATQKTDAELNAMSQEELEVVREEAESAIDGLNRAKDVAAWHSASAYLGRVETLLFKKFGC